MQKPTRIAPSILAADFAKLGDEVRALSQAGADYIHVDVMDGHFAPNITMGPNVVQAIRPYTDKIMDVHLMIAPVAPYIQDFVDAGADIISFHPEAEFHPHRTVQAIKNAGCKAGIVLNPSTSPDVVDYLMDALDLILVMTVNPGFGGQKLIDSQIAKIKILRAKIDASGRDIDLQVDGGVTADNAQQLIQAGADCLVAGTATFKGGSEKYAENIAKIRG